MLTEILYHFQLAVGAGSPTGLNDTDRLNKPAPTHPKSPPVDIGAKTGF
ncbi:hypothetical protein [Microcoleus sp. CAWBG58]|nr:hypothetical protein [Microcoleus sp. CAWBG58]